MKTARHFKEIPPSGRCDQLLGGRYFRVGLPLYRQLPAYGSVVAGNSRHVALPASMSPLRLRFGLEVSAHQHRANDDRRKTYDPNHGVLYDRHSENMGWAQSCMFRPDGKICYEDLAVSKQMKLTFVLLGRPAAAGLAAGRFMGRGKPGGAGKNHEVANHLQLCRMFALSGGWGDGERVR